MLVDGAGGVDAANRLLDASLFYVVRFPNRPITFTLSTKKKQTTMINQLSDTLIAIRFISDPVPIIDPIISTMYFYHFPGSIGQEVRLSPKRKLKVGGGLRLNGTQDRP